MTAPITPDPPHVEQASKLHSVFAALEGLLHLVENPAIVGLLPTKYQRYAVAVAIAHQAFTDAPPAAAP